MKANQGEDMLKTLLVTALVALLAACNGSNPGDEDGESDVETDGVLPDGVDAVPDGSPDVPDPDVTPDMPCYCGNAIHEPECDEECDDGNYESVDDCIACTLAVCGDRLLRSLPADPSDAEECDDGNDVAGDG